MTKRERQIVYDKCGGKCAYCGCELNNKFQIDHVISQRAFATHILNKWKIPEFLTHLGINDMNHIDNLLPACGSCNNYKGAFDLELFRSEIGQLVGRMNKRFTQYKISKRFGLIQETKKPVTFYFEYLQATTGNKQI
jgi:hypothetical protein